MSERLFSPIRVNDSLCLTEIRPNDADTFVRLLNEPAIYEMTLRIPFPYHLTDAYQWISMNQSLFSEGKILNWAIRDTKDELIGVIGFNEDVVIGETHRTEIGYWLGKPYWGKGLMTQVLERFCALAFEEHKLVRLTATIFAFNPASARVAEKCGFVLEGRMESYYKKDGKIFDGLMYARLRPSQ